MPAPVRSRPQLRARAPSLRRVAAAWIVLLSAWVAGCGDSSAASVSSDELLVAVATNFEPTFRELAARFTEETAIRVRVVAGATGALHAQIHAGAPFDLLFAADRARPRELEHAGLALAGTRRVYAHGRLALCGELLGSEALRDADRPLRDRLREALDHPSVRRIAIADPESAPYGAAALRALQTLERAEPLRSRCARARSVAQSLQFVLSGAADLGFVALSSLTTLEDAEQPPSTPPWIELPTELTGVVVQEAVALRHSKSPESARRLLDWLDTEPVRELLVDHGYGSP